MSTPERSIDDIVESLKTAKSRGRGVAVLLGAGCSVSAGIPLADEFVEIIRTKWPRAYNRAPRKQYTDCMGELSSGDRAELIREQVDTQKINWAHLCLAKLMEQDYVDRVLTTNFDPLIVRACSLLRFLPAVYDFGSFTHPFKAHTVPKRAVFYLHGQSTGFVLRNTEHECKEHIEALKVVFTSTNEQKLPWIVIGYSGQNDHVIHALATIREFDYSLYWVPYKNEQPGDQARELILTPQKSAFPTNGYDADHFFIELTRRLDCFPDELVRQPFSYLLHCLDTLTPYPMPGEERTLEAITETRRWVQSAIDEHETRVSKSGGPEALDKLLVDARSALMAGDFDKVIQIAAQRRSPALVDLHAWALLSQGIALTEQAKTRSGEEAARLLAKAAAKFEEVLRIKPDFPEALNDWGINLAGQARTKSGEEADRLFAEAAGKYEAALKIKPNNPEVLNNWGVALTDQAKTKSGGEADRLFAEAAGKYEAALKIKPNFPDALNNWGVALSDRAKTKSGGEADQLFAEAAGKYEVALKIKPNDPEVLNNWGVALADQAKTKSGEEADRLFAEAAEKCEAALKIKPNFPEALNNWGNVLADQAKTRSGEESVRLLAEAVEKYEAALKIKPNDPEVLSNWGVALADQAKTKSGEEANRLFAEAVKKYEAALKIKPNFPEALYNWGNALVDQAKTKSGEEAFRLFAEAAEKCEAALKIKPDSSEAFNNWGTALAGQARTKSEEEAFRLFAEAVKKYEAALKIKPNDPEVLSNWGAALAGQARTKSEEEAFRLFAEAVKKYEAALKIKPNDPGALVNWCNALAGQAKTRSGEEADRLFTEAVSKCEAALKAKPGDWTLLYNRACVAALRGNEGECRSYLEASIQNGIRSSRHEVESDSDFVSVRDKPWFLSLLDKIK